MPPATSDTSPPACDISICVVNWNGRQLLDDLLQSLARDRAGSGGTSPSHEAGYESEIIVVDNASTDGSIEMLAERYPQVRVIRNESNAGFSRANNQAADMARGRHLLFLNNDTRVTPGAVRTLVEYLDAHPEAAAAGPKLVYADGGRQPSCCRLPRAGLFLGRLKMLSWTRWARRAAHKHRMRDIEPDREQPVEMMIGAALIVRREPFAACGRWDERFNFCVEDTDLCRRLAAHGKLVYVPSSVVVHIGSVSAKANPSYTYRNLEMGYSRYIRKHGGWWMSALYKLLVSVDQLVWIVSLMIRIVRSRIIGEREKISPARARLALVARFTLLDLPRYWRS